MSQSKKWLPWAIVGLLAAALIAIVVVFDPFNLFGESERSGVGGEDSKVIVARVGSSKMSLDDYKTLLSIYVPPESQGQVDPMEIIEAWIQQEIIYQEAKRLGVDKKDTVKIVLGQLRYAFEQQRRQLLAQAWLAEESEKIEVTDSEVQNYFQSHKDEFTYEVKVSQIAVQDPMAAAQIYTQLQQGANFKDLARQYTIDPLQGEPSSFLPRGSGLFTLEMEDAIFSMEPGQFTQPFMTPQGISLIFRLETKSKVRKDVSMEEVSEYIESMLLTQKAEQVLAAKLDSLRQAASTNIEINIENLLY